MANEVHGIDRTYYDNLGGGWRMDCTCGFTTCPDVALSVVGEEMDEHFSTADRTPTTAPQKEGER